MERLFANMFSLTELERKNLKKSKQKYLDGLLVYCLFFLTMRRNQLSKVVKDSTVSPKNKLEPS